MNWKKRIIVLLSILFAMVLFVACGDSNDNANKNNSNSEGNENGNTNSNGDGKPTTITLMSTLHTSEVPNDRILDILEEKTNVELEIDWVPDNNYNEKLNTAFATGTLPQVVSVGFQQMDQFKEAIRDDQFWEIGPYIEEFENLNKLKEPVLENLKVGGKIYGLYQGGPLSRQGYIYRKDWADNLGIDTPTTTEEFYEMARAFTEDDPNNSGKDDTIGLTDRSDLIYGGFKTVSSWFGTPNYWGEKDGELLPEFMFPEYIETMDFFKDLRDNGYINRDFPVTSKDDQQAMFKNGTAGIYVGSIGDVVSIYKDAIDLDPEVEYDVQNYVEGPDGQYGIWATPGYGSQLLFSKSSIETEEELKDILAFYDQLMTPEIANLIQWGVEDEHYTVTDDGKAQPTEDSDKIDREVKPYMTLSIGEAETNGRYEGFHDYDVREKADELIKDNEDYLIHDPTIPLESNTDIEQGERLQEIINDATYNYILGEIDKEGFEAEVEKWQQQGGDDIIEEYNASE